MSHDKSDGMEGQAAATLPRPPPAAPPKASGDAGMVSEGGDTASFSSAAGTQLWASDSSDITCVASPLPLDSILSGVGSYTMGNVSSRDVKVGIKAYRDSLHAVRWFFPTRLMVVCLLMGSVGVAFAQVLGSAAYSIVLAELSTQGCSAAVASARFSDVAMAFSAVVTSFLNVQMLIPAFIHQRESGQESCGGISRALCTMTLSLLLANSVGFLIGRQDKSGGTVGVFMLALWATLWSAGPVTCAYFHMRPAGTCTGCSREHVFLVLCVVLRVVGTTLFFIGFQIAGLGATLILAAFGIWLTLDWRRRPGQRGFSASILLGYVNCASAGTFLDVWSNVASELGPAPALVFWVAVCLAFKSFVFTLAENSVPNAWVACATLPFCVVEDLIPMLIFGTAGDLNVHFWVSSSILCVWEIVRDSPRVKERIVAGVKSAAACVKKPRCCPGRCGSPSCDCGPLPSLGSVTLTTFFGGGMAAEVVEEAAEGVAEQTAEAQRGRIAMKIDIARCNMVSELCCAGLLLVVVSVTHLQGEHQVFSPGVVAVCFAMQATSVTVATAINVRSLQEMQVALAQWGVSRFALACSGAYVAGAVGLTVYIQFMRRIEEKLGCWEH